MNTKLVHTYIIYVVAIVAVAICEQQFIGVEGNVVSFLMAN